LLQQLADETGATVWAKTGAPKPWGGGDGIWIEYKPGGDVPYKGKGFIGSTSKKPE
jgi:hypothetical protein